jgi:hypothetical protein
VCTSATSFGRTGCSPPGAADENVFNGGGETAKKPYNSPKPGYTRV